MPSLTVQQRLALCRYDASRAWLRRSPLTAAQRHALRALSDDELLAWLNQDGVFAAFTRLGGIMAGRMHTRSIFARYGPPPRFDAWAAIHLRAMRSDLSRPRPARRGAFCRLYPDIELPGDE